MAPDVSSLGIQSLKRKAFVPQNMSKQEFTALQNLSKNKDLIIQKSDKGNSVVIVQRQDYLEKMNEILSD